MSETTYTITVNAQQVALLLETFDKISVTMRTARAAADLFDAVKAARAVVGEWKDETAE
jgi:hypothetical protein